jgi:glycerol transport system permease protein
VLLIEIPLGIAIALTMPTKGRWRRCADHLAIPLLIPWNVVGTIWQIFGRADIGLLGATSGQASATTTRRPMDAWVTVLVMDVWHWTSLVALLCYSGLRIPTCTTRRRASTGPRPGRCSATSSCPS